MHLTPDSEARKLKPWGLNGRLSMANKTVLVVEDNKLNMKTRPYDTKAFLETIDQYLKWTSDK